MTVYVDDMRARFGRMVMCHMVADTTDELLRMADSIEVPRKWIQKAGTPGEHFDIALTKRAAAIRAGAVPITMRELVTMVRHRRAHGVLCSVEEARRRLALPIEAPR